MTITEHLTIEQHSEPAPPALSVVDPRPVNLRVRLTVFDLVAIVLAWVPVMFLGDVHQRSVLDGLFLTTVAVTLGMWLLHMNELYLARVSSVRSIELSRLLRVTGLEIGGMLIALRVYHTDTRVREVVMGAIVMLCMLVIARSAYRAWVSAGRRSGRFVRDVLLVGTNNEAAELAQLLEEHPETGFRIAGVVGDRLEAMSHQYLIDRWKGEAADAPAILWGTDVNGVVIVVGALETEELNELVRELQARKVHMHLSNGVRGINYRRLRAAPIAHEPLFYVEQPELRRHQQVAKRFMDLLVTCLTLVPALPIMAIIAAAIWFGDRGPILFKQVRVGKDGKEFKVWKFRTMVVDAEARLRELQATNERSGPLFKMEHDPRITRVGRLLRETSLDELPQLFNVLRGEMSLVGPRPALPAEVAQFDQRLLERTKVLPGITGLWQSEARDNPSFHAYRRLDLFYVDNWSLALDLVIVLATVEQVLTKALRSLRPRRSAATADVEQPHSLAPAKHAA